MVRLMESAPRSRAQVELIPFDPESPHHVERLYQQRVACGWKEDWIEEWRVLQREGKVGLHWVTLPSTSPLLPTFITQHIALYPSESSPLYDTAGTVFSTTRNSHPATAFQPFGHLSLDSTHEDADLANPVEGIYCITALYVSRALHNSGLGRAAMLAMEEIAEREPVCAKTVTLDTVSREDQASVEKCKVFNIPVPKLLNQDWYERMGYVAFHRKSAGWVETDPTGKEWPTPIVLMRKKIG